MAVQAVGLRTYIWNNNAKSILLLVLFPLLVMAVAFALMVVFQAYAGAEDVDVGLAAAWADMPAAASVALVGSGVWYAVAALGHQGMIDAATGARRVERGQEPELYNLLENLCISRGLPMPRLRIIETDARNAFASGLSDETYAVTVTRGLMQGLEADELEAVLAHELTHIRNRDVRLLVVAAVFVGVIGFFAELAFRNMFRVNLPRSDRHRRSGGGNAALLLAIAIGILAVAYLFAVIVRFALSRRREYLADAGAAELTKNPDAMARALEKVAGRSDVSRAPTEVREMFLEHKASGFAGMLATHPPIEKRIEALRSYGGALAPT